MAYSPNLPAAAQRHLQAADNLFDGSRHKAVSGYLYGIAAECAVKAMMQELGFRPILDDRTSDPFYAHFPKLKTLLSEAQLPRAAKGLRAFVEDPNFMSQWDTSMRYSQGGDIQATWIERWREQARQAVSSIGT